MIDKMRELTDGQMQEFVKVLEKDGFRCIVF